MKPSILILSIIILVGLNGQAQTLTTGTTGKAFQCQLDTIKGTVFYVIPTESGNEGNFWDHGYWVGKCGPFAIWAEGMDFVPGIFKRTYQWKWTKDKNWRLDHESIDNGKFYDSQWHEIPSKNVYGLVIKKP